MKNKHLLLVIMIMIIFGSTYPVGKLATNQLPPILFAGLRVFALMMILTPFWRFKLPPKKLFLPLIIFSLSMGIGVYVPMYCALEISSLVSPIIIGTQLSVPFGILLSYFFLSEKITFKRWFFILTSFFGIIVLAYDPNLNNEWFVLIVMCIFSFFYALSNILSRYLKEIDIFTLNGWHALSCIPIFLISFIFEGNPFPILFPMTIEVISLILYVAIFVSLFGHASMFYLYKFYPVAKVLPFYSLFPVLGILLSYIIFGEIPSTYIYIGGFIVIGSVFILHIENNKEFDLSG